MIYYSSNGKIDCNLLANRLIQNLFHVAGMFDFVAWHQVASGASQNDCWQVILSYTNGAWLVHKEVVAVDPGCCLRRLQVMGPWLLLEEITSGGSLIAALRNYKWWVPDCCLGKLLVVDPLWLHREVTSGRPLVDTEVVKDVCCNTLVNNQIESSNCYCNILILSHILWIDNEGFFYSIVISYDYVYVSESRTDLQIHIHTCVISYEYVYVSEGRYGGIGLHIYTEENGNGNYNSHLYILTVR